MNDQTVPAIDEQAFDLSCAPGARHREHGVGSRALAAISPTGWIGPARAGRRAGHSQHRKGADLTGMAEEAVADGIDLITWRAVTAPRPPSPAPSPAPIRRWR